ncbi:hypothetical protein LCGC14_1762100 [marine sediment metagenome]|uniref:Uncharacterized protein n=1 Tax=marine sediment metagenome TaxID=412755 RepID=A0A0F9K0C9_9ZZZZ
MTLTLKQFINKCKELTDQGDEVWIEGIGDGRWKLIIERIEVGDTNGKANA